MSYVRCACNISSVYHASVVRGCVPLSASSSFIYHFQFLKHHHSAASHHHHRRCQAHLSYPGKLHTCRANNYFLYFFSILGSMYLVLFSIVLYRKIVTVYTYNIFLYIYLWQMHQIIHLSPVGCFTPARGKTMQKNCEVSWVKVVISISVCNFIFK